MSELPDTSDPFVLLGVEPGVEEVEIRRAYAALIRTYRPDRAPHEFQRIREAFDQARYLTRTGMWQAMLEEEQDEPPVDVEEDDPEGEIDPRPPAPTRDVVEAAWDAAAEGQAHARAILAAAPAAELARASAHRYLLDEFDGASFDERSAALLKTWEEGVPIIWWLRHLLDLKELRALVDLPAFHWKSLRTVADRQAAESMFELRIQMLLVDQEHALVRDEICDGAFVDDAVDRANLERVAGEVACVLQWRMPQGARDLQAAFGGAVQRGDQNWGLDAHEQAARDHHPAWRAVSKRPTTPRPFVVFFELWPVLDRPLLLQVAETLVNDIQQRPAAYAVFFESLAREAPAVLVHYITAIQYLVGHDDPKFTAYREQTVHTVVSEGRERGKQDRRARTVEVAGWWLTGIVTVVLGVAALATDDKNPAGAILAGTALIGACVYIAFASYTQKRRQNVQRAWTQAALDARRTELGLDTPQLLNDLLTSPSDSSPLNRLPDYESREAVQMAFHWTTRLESMLTPAVEEPPTEDA